MVEYRHRLSETRIFFHVKWLSKSKNKGSGRLGDRWAWSRVEATRSCFWVRKGRSRRRRPQRVGELRVNYQLGFLKPSAACKWKGQIRQQEQESRASPRLQRSFCKPTHFSAFNSDDDGTLVLESELLWGTTLHWVSLITWVDGMMQSEIRD